MIDLSTLTDKEIRSEFQRRFADEYAAGKAEQVAELEIAIRQISLQLREAEKSKSAFLSNVKNEVNNPLASILGLSEQIATHCKDQQLKQIGKIIFKQSFELDYQMRNVITAAEIELGEIRPVAAVVNINSLFTSQIVYLEPKIQSAGIRLNLSMPEQQQTFTTDAYLLQIIFSNLLGNAIEFSNSNGTVSINVWIKDHLYIEVKDQGEGIADDKLSVVFERFRQLDAGTTKTHHGHGLGLSIVQELVELLGGGVKIWSEFTKGTTVLLHLPSLTTHVGASGSSSYGNEILFNEGEVF